MPDESLIATWTGWLDDLRRDLFLIHHHREMWTTVSEAMREKASDTPSTWLNHYQRLYVDGQVIAVRRLIRAKQSQDSISLGKLLESISRNADVLTVDRYLRRWYRRNDDPLQLERGRCDYEANWSDGSGNLDLRRVRRDHQELNRIAVGVIKVADQSVAHTLSGRPDTSLTFSELNEAIDHVGSTYQQYTVLVTGTYYALTPVVQDDWRSSFYMPLFDAPAWSPLPPEAD